MKWRCFVKPVRQHILPLMSMAFVEWSASFVTSSARDAREFRLQFIRARRDHTATFAPDGFDTYFCLPP